MTRISPCSEPLLGLVRTRLAAITDFSTFADSYASLLDGSSDDPSYATVGKTGQLFFSKLRALTGSALDGYETDTIRQPIAFV